MTQGVRATVVVPTSIDRGPLLEHSVGSALAQSVRDIEVFAVGDGVSEETRAAAQALERADSRVRFFDFPKSTRRGEENRHAVLQEARGEIVCYLCDRDLWLPNHVETMLARLAGNDFAGVIALDPGGLTEDDRQQYPPRLFGLSDPANAADRKRFLRYKGGLPLSAGAHTLAAYRALPYGWRETPVGTYTDQYMWAQFLERESCRAALHLDPTVLYFKREHHPGWPTARRLVELQHWSARLDDRAAIDAVLRPVLVGALPTLIHGRRTSRQPIALGGRTPREALAALMRRMGLRRN